MTHGSDSIHSLLIEAVGRLSIRSNDGGFHVRLPFTDYAGDNIELLVTPTTDSLALDDVGHTAEMLFELAQHGEDSPGHQLVRSLAETYGLTMDYNRGLLMQWVRPEADESKIMNFIKVLISLQTAVPEMPFHKTARRRETRLRTRLGREIQMLSHRECVQRGIDIQGRHDFWPVDFKYTFPRLGESTDVFIVTADLKLREPKQKAEHVLAMAIDVMEGDRKPNLRVVFDLNGDGPGSAARNAAELIVQHQDIGYTAYNYKDPEQAGKLKALTLQELSPMLSR